MDRKLKIWLWLSIVLTAAGALLLYPIGTTALNCIFIAVKIGMVSGLLSSCFRREKPACSFGPFAARALLS